jgi:hypothetical protein
VTLPFGFIPDCLGIVSQFDQFLTVHSSPLTRNEFPQEPLIYLNPDDIVLRIVSFVLPRSNLD